MNFPPKPNYRYRQCDVHDAVVVRMRFIVLQSGYAGCLARGKKKSSLIFSKLGVFMLETYQMINLNSFEASGIRIIFLRAHQVRDVDILDTGQLPLDGG